MPTKKQITHRSKFKPEFIIWEDAASIDEWTSLENFNANSPALIHSIGFLLEENDQRLVLALNVDEENESASCIMIIPKKMIKARISLDK